jgi:hypothetical protein
LHVTPQVEFTHTAIPLSLTGGDGQMLPQAEQFAASLVRSRHPAGQLVWPVGQVAQSVPVLLQPLGHAIDVAPHVPFASHIAGSVSTPFEHDLPAPHSVQGPLLPLSTQVDAPVVHAVTPVLHGFVGWQA